MKNSIRDNTTKDDMIAEIKLLLDADYTRSGMIVVVEGQDDLIFFNGKFTQNVDVKESFSGKEGVKEIVELFSDNRVIGVCDKDYDLAESNCRILFYDYSCLEMMMISCDNAFRNFCNTYYRGKESSNAIRKHVLEDLQSISCYRQLNAINGWAIRFTGIDYSKSYDYSASRLNHNTVMDQLRNSNPELEEGVYSQLQQVDKLSKTCMCLDELLSITNGHDFLWYFQILCISCNRYFSTNKDNLFKSLVCSYGIEYFMLSDLYRRIKAYQEKTAISILLPV